MIPNLFVHSLKETRLGKQSGFDGENIFQPGYTFVIWLPGPSVFLFIYLSIYLEYKFNFLLLLCFEVCMPKFALFIFLCHSIQTEPIFKFSSPPCLFFALQCYSKSKSSGTFFTVCDTRGAVLLIR